MRALDALPRIAELSLEAARQAGSLAASALRTVAAPVLGRQRPDEEAGGSTRNREPPGAPRAGDAPAPPAPRAAPAPRPAPGSGAARPAPEPAHVDRDAIVVAESADAGAADGPGAQIRVDEPWDGYDRLTAKDITAQLATADQAMLAVVRLYESTNRKRRTVLAEIDRRLA